MYISRIVVRNFRNFRQLDISVKGGVTCFIGENNTGKTNLLYAIRLVLDGGISTYRRRLQVQDIAQGLSFSTPEQVLVSVEFADFAGKPHEEALLHAALLPNGKARITYRFRPNRAVRDEFDQLGEGATLRPLALEDYTWELTGGGNVDLSAVTWIDPIGVYFSVENLQQGFLVVPMEALRDVEGRLAAPRTSPLQQIVEQRNIPAAEQEALVQHLRDANDTINQSATVNSLGGDLTQAFREAAGSAFAMEVSLGLGETTFGDVSRGLKVLLSGYGVTRLDPSRNGLGLNNVLFISLLLNYFQNRLAAQRTAGQLLLVEEPEAHLHPQLQRVLLGALQQRSVQVFITTHSTHVTSAVPLESQVILTSGGTATTSCVAPASIPAMTGREVSDLDRYLDATRSTLLYARRVLLVEGPAELFLLPGLIKKAMGVDLDDQGIAVVPIFGTHFDVYAKLFGEHGIRKRCAIVADGDLVPSDAAPNDAIAAGDDIPTPTDLSHLHNPYVQSFVSDTTFELEMTLAENLEMFERAAVELGKNGTAAAIATGRAALANGHTIDLPALAQRVLNMAKSVGKARFAQVASRHISPTPAVPDYVRSAVTWLTDATH